MIKLIYGIILGLSLVGMISAIILTCCTVVRIRFIIYMTCSGLIFMGIITFAMLIFVGGLLPNVGQSCAYIDGKLSS